MAFNPEIINNKMVTYQGINDYNQILIHEIPRMGRNNDFTGNINLTWGRNNISQGSNYSFLFGEGNMIKPQYSSSVGSGTGSCHFLFGKDNLVHRNIGHGFVLGEGLIVGSNGTEENGVGKSIFMIGQYNAAKNITYTNTAMVIGNGSGTADTERSNLLQLDYNGFLRVFGNGGVEYGADFKNDDNIVVTELKNTGLYGLAFGVGAQNWSSCGFSFGQHTTNGSSENTSKGVCGFAFGNGVINTGTCGFAFGSTAKNSADGGFAFGILTENKGAASFAFGHNTINEGSYSFVFGSSLYDANGKAYPETNSENRAKHSILFGPDNKITPINTDSGAGSGHVVLGSSNVVHREKGHAILLGHGLTIASETNNYETTVGLGSFNKTEDINYANTALVIGKGVGESSRSNLLQLDYDGSLRIYGSGGIAYGDNTSNEGKYGIAYGVDTNNIGECGIALGYNNINKGKYSIVTGYCTQVDSTMDKCPVVVIGRYNQPIKKQDIEGENLVFCIGIGKPGGEKENGLTVDYNGCLKTKKIQVEQSISLLMETNKLNYNFVGDGDGGIYQGTFEYNIPCLGLYAISIDNLPPLLNTNDKFPRQFIYLCDKEKQKVNIYSEEKDGYSFNVYYEGHTLKFEHIVRKAAEGYNEVNVNIKQVSLQSF